MGKKYGEIKRDFDVFVLSVCQEIYFFYDFYDMNFILGIEIKGKIFFICN